LSQSDESLQCEHGVELRPERKVLLLAGWPARVADACHCNLVLERRNAVRDADLFEQ
jgi:hypothetical protein